MEVKFEAFIVAKSKNSEEAYTKLCDLLKENGFEFELEIVKVSKDTKTQGA